MVEASLQVPAPYVCDMCKKFVEEELGSLPGVEMASAEVSTRRVAVRFDERLVPIERIEEVVHRYGCHLTCWYWTDERYKHIPVDLHI